MRITCERATVTLVAKDRVKIAVGWIAILIVNLFC